MVHLLLSSVRFCPKPATIGYAFAKTSLAGCQGRICGAIHKHPEFRCDLSTQIPKQQPTRLSDTENLLRNEKQKYSLPTTCKQKPNNNQQLYHSKLWTRPDSCWNRECPPFPEHNGETSDAVVHRELSPIPLGHPGHPKLTAHQA